MTRDTEASRGLGRAAGSEGDELKEFRSDEDELRGCGFCRIRRRPVSRSGTNNGDLLAMDRCQRSFKSPNMAQCAQMAACFRDKQAAIMFTELLVWKPSSFALHHNTHLVKLSYASTPIPASTDRLPFGGSTSAKPLLEARDNEILDDLSPAMWIGDGLWLVGVGDDSTMVGWASDMRMYD